MLGDWLSLVAVASVAVESGEGALAIAWVMVAHTLPAALMTPFTGALADRFDRRHVIGLALVAQALVTAAMLGAALAGAVFWLTALTLLRSSVGAFVAPARSAALKDLVEPSELLTANALEASTWSVLFSTGMVLGGLLSAISPALALAIDTGTFVVAAALIAGLPSLLPPPRSAKSALARLSEAARAIADDSGLWRAITAKAPVALAGGAGWVVMNLVSTRVTVLGSAAATFGVLQAARGIGAGIGPVLSEKIVGADRGLAERLIWLAAPLIVFASVAALLASSSFGWLLAVVFIWGIGTGANWVIASAALQRRASRALIGRLSALDIFLHTGAICLGALLAGGLTDLTRSEPIALFVALALAGLAFVGSELVAQRTARLGRRSTRRSGLSVAGR